MPRSSITSSARSRTSSRYVTGLRRVQQREIAAHRARGLERVVHRGQVLAQERALAEAVHQPQVLVGGDVREVPDQWAHQRRMDALEIVLGHRRHQRERPPARLLKCVDDPRRSQRGSGCDRTVH